MELYFSETPLTEVKSCAVHQLGFSSAFVRFCVFSYQNVYVFSSKLKRRSIRIFSIQCFAHNFSVQPEVCTFSCGQKFAVHVPCISTLTVDGSEAIACVRLDRFAVCSRFGWLSEARSYD